MFKISKRYDLYDYHYDYSRDLKQRCHYNNKGRKPMADVRQDADQYTDVDQESNELIIIKDSYNCSVESTDTQAAASLQVGLQLAIALVLRITLFDSDSGDAVAQELMQSFSTVQSNYQKVMIENCKDVRVVTTDTDLTVNIQALLEVLLTLVTNLDIS